MTIFDVLLYYMKFSIHFFTNFRIKEILMVSSISNYSAPQSLPSASTPKKITDVTWLDKKITEIESKIRIKTIVCAIFITLAVLAAAATIAIGFLATPFIGVSIPVVLLSIFLAIGMSPSCSYENSKSDLFHRVLSTENQPKLVYRYAKVCNTIDLDQSYPSLKLSTLKRWLLNALTLPNLRDSIDQALVLKGPDLSTSSPYGIMEWNRHIKLLADFEFNYASANNQIQQDKILEDQIQSVLIKWKYLEKSIGDYNPSPIRIENVPILISSLGSLKKINLGTCINPDIVAACAAVKIEEISLHYSTPVFDETIKELVEMTSLKKIQCCIGHASHDAMLLMWKYFRPEQRSAEMREYTTWVRN